MTTAGHSDAVVTWSPSINVKVWTHHHTGYGLSFRSREATEKSCLRGVLQYPSWTVREVG